MKIVITSGGFDPLHVGHIECFKKASSLGDYLIVIVNRDSFLMQKKGFVFMPENERLELVKSIRYVGHAELAVDDDLTVCRTLQMLAEKYLGYEVIFAKGGDRFADNIPEKDICDKYNIKIVDGLGEKIQSSSWLTGRIRDESFKL